MQKTTPLNSKGIGIAMASTPDIDLTEILIAFGSDDNIDKSEADQIFEIVYNELRRVAGGMMRRERVDHTLQPTALVHEAYCRLVDQTRIEWENRAHFFGIAARAMRQILVNYAYKRGAAKRGGDWQRITLDERLSMGTDPEVQILELDDALNKLAEMDERMAKVVELRVFAGMRVEEVAHMLSVSKRTVLKDWKVAKMWLHRLLTEGTAT
jgi:RNA polymerase sigma factor (TIGR02999 family)